MGKVIARKQEEAKRIELALDSAIRRHKADEQKEINPEKFFGGFFEHKIRSLEDLDRKYKTEKSYVHHVSRHLFAKYYVPGFMNQVWFRQRDFCSWFIAVGKGDSLYKKCAKPYMTKKATHLFLSRGRKDLTICENIWLARATAEGVDPNIGIRWSKIKPNICVKLNDEFWLSVFKFFLRNPIDKGRKLNEVIDFLEDKHANDRIFSLKGRTLKSLIDLSDQWHYDMARIKDHGSGFWEGLLTPDWRKEYGKGELKRSYDIVQILSGKELSREGNAMRHCVYSYKRKCLSGTSAIFSMRKTMYETGRKEVVTRRCLTIEVNRDKRIVQFSGYANKGCSPVERNVLSDWAKDCGLTY